MQYRIKASRLHGAIKVPPSKSHTLRAILFASLAKGESVIHHYLPSPDTAAMLNACERFGARIRVETDTLVINGVDGHPKTPDNVVDAGNSGLVLRMGAAVASLCSDYTVLTGDESIRSRRPVRPLLQGLSTLGVLAVSTQQNDLAPIVIKGPLQGGISTLNGEDSQPVSALLIAAAFAPQPTVIHVTDPGEKPWIDLTLDWLQRLGIVYERQGYTQYTVQGNASYPGFEYTVPGDFSSCAFPLVAALITGSNVVLHHLDMHDVQGDKALIHTLQQMGANIVSDAATRTLHISPSSQLSGARLDVNQYIDALPILAVLSCFSKGETLLTGAAIARKKESDRLTAIAKGLQAMGADIQELPDGLCIRPTPLHGATVSSFSDHRIAMALAVAGLAAQGETVIDDIACVAKTYPNFLESMQALGANMVCVS